MKRLALAMSMLAAPAMAQSALTPEQRRDAQMVQNAMSRTLLEQAEIDGALAAITRSASVQASMIAALETDIMALRRAYSESQQTIALLTKERDAMKEAATKPVPKPSKP